MIAVVVIALVVYLRTLAPTITWAHNGADGGDFVAAVATQGIPHPTGYPTYVLLGRLFLLIPWGDQAHRLNLMSAFFAILTVALLYRIVLQTFRLFGDGPVDLKERLIAAASALTFAFSPLFWSQALITEVYTLNAFFVALIIYLVLRWLETPWYGFLSAAALAYGLGLGNHVTIALLAPALLLLLSYRRRDLPSETWKLLALALPFALGLSVYLYLPLRAVHHPPINWGDPRTLQRFLWLVSGRLYRRYFFNLPLRYLPSRLSAWATLLVQQFGWWGLFLGLVGWWALWQKARRIALFSLVLFLGYSIYAIGYDTADSQAYLIPPFLTFALWLGWGLDLLLEELRRLIASSKSRLLRALPLCLAVLLPLLSLVGNFSSMDLSADDTARDYGMDVLEVVEDDAILIPQTDAHTFTLWYFRYAEGRRPDVAIVGDGLLRYEWYRRNTARVHPDITLPSRVIQVSGESQGAPPYSLITFIEGNRDHHPIYLTDPGAQIHNRYELSEVGPVYRIVARREE